MAAQTAGAAALVPGLVTGPLASRVLRGFEAATVTADEGRARREHMERLCLQNECVQEDVDLDEALDMPRGSPLWRRVLRRSHSLLSNIVLSERPVPDDIFENMKVDARSWVETHTRASEYRSVVRPDGESVSLKYLLLKPGRLFKLYDAECQGEGLGRTMFLKQIRDSDEFTNQQWYTSHDSGEGVMDRIGEMQAPVNKFAKHLKNWGHQTRRFEDRIATLEPGTLLLVMDFKEKTRKGKSVAELQMDYFGGEYLSLMGVVVFYVEDGVTKRKNIMICSADGNQDTDWAAKAMDIALPMILALAPEDGVVLEMWKDSGPHYHNNIFLNKLKLILEAQPKILRINDEYFEPGEAKSVADQFFACVGSEIESWISLGNDLNTFGDLQRVLGQMSNTTAFELDIDRDQFTAEYEAHVGMSKYLSYTISRPDFKWRARELTCAGPEVVLRGTAVTRDKKLDKGAALDLLAKSLARTTAVYGGASNILHKLIDSKKGGVRATNAGYTAPAGKANDAGAALVALLEAHFRAVYPVSHQEALRASSNPRLPASWAAFLVKAEQRMP
ncbi:hypothetical protein M885DRAFT_501689 [Pelagophyceae sp. CCMP2097]|nr:hypothetical protein M885DRAFT_501689 [Pelagophyceae sp. CCMP2097]